MITFTNVLPCSGGEIGNLVDLMSKFCGMFGKEKCPENVLATKNGSDYPWALLLSTRVQSRSPPIPGNVPFMQSHVSTQQDGTA